MITYGQLRAIMPHAGQGLQQFVVPLDLAMQEFEINTKVRQAAFLAQVAHESGSFRYMEEIASGADYETRNDLGNTKPEAIEIAVAHGSTPGRWFKGHGPIQITGYDNHLQCGIALGLDLLNDPRLITQPTNGCRSAGWFWKSRGCNDLADAGKFEALTRRINGGLNGYEDRVAYLERATETLT